MSVRWKLELTPGNKSFPDIVAVVGMTRAPHKMRIIEKASDWALLCTSAGTRSEATSRSKKGRWNMKLYIIEEGGRVSC